jgi:hypothetical protein
MTKLTKKLTCYQRGSRDLKIYRAQKARDKAYSEELSRERWRNYQADYSVTSAGRDAERIANEIRNASDRASQDAAGLAVLIGWKIAFWAIILMLFWSRS